MRILYFLADAAAFNGENADLFVRAESLENAISCWRDYFELAADAQPQRAFQVPEIAGPPGAIGWDTVIGL